MRCEGYCGGDAKRTLDCALPALGNGHTHEAHAAQMRNGCVSGGFGGVGRVLD